MLKRLAFILALLLLPCVAEAACTGSSPAWTCNSWADLKTLVEAGGAVVSGDVVTIGDLTATSALTITKGITIQGASCTLETVNGIAGIPTSCPSVITLNYASDNILVTLEAAKTTRFSNIEFQDASELSAGYIFSIIGCNIGSPQRQIRLDHIFFNDMDRPIGHFYAPVGVVDHNNIRHSFGAFNYIEFKVNGVYYNSCGVNDFGDASMYAAQQPGSDQSLYFEDNNFDNTGSSQLVGFDCDLGGARFVVRFNSFDNTNVQCHGFEVTRYRGQRTLEWYLNDLHDGNDTLQTPFYLRGGAGYFWGNTIEGWTSTASFALVNNQQFQSFPFPFGNNGGRGPWDVNGSLAVATGTCASVTASTCTVSGTPFTPNAWESSTVAYMINRTTGGITMASAALSGTTLTFTSSGNHGFATNDIVGCWGANDASYGYNSVFTITKTGDTTFTAYSGDLALPASMVTGGTYRCAEGSNFATVVKNTNNTITWAPEVNAGYGLQLAAGDAFEINVVVNTIDQTCRGGGSLLSGSYPTLPGGWNDQVTDGCYDWLNAREAGALVVLSSGYNAGTPCTNLPGQICTSNTMRANSEFWNYTASFTGATGVGSGVVASLPATCTTGVAYWATNEGSWNAGSNSFYTGQGNLYKCVATNDWDLWYTPYAYPHPLVSGLILTSITPDFGERDSTVMDIAIVGTELEGGDMGASTVVAVSGTGVTPSCVVDSDVLITCDFAITAMATLGDRTVIVTTDEGTSNALTFTVIGTDAPVLTSFTPPQGVAGASYSFTMTGTGFDGGNATINDNCASLTFANIVATATKITALASIAAGAGGASCDVTVETDDGESNPVTYTINALTLAGYGKGRTRRGR